MSNRLEDARKLLQDMESGSIGVTPGPTCYDGFILTCAQNRAWDDILAAHETMQLLNVPLSPASCHGILLAALKLGDRLLVKQYVEAFVSSNAQLYGDGAVLALRILLDGVISRGEGDNGELTLDTVRERLRILGQSEPSLVNECLHLIRSLRMAESEESRHLGLNGNKNTRVLPLSVLLDRRHVAWHTMLTSLLNLINIVEKPTVVQSKEDAVLSLPSTDRDMDCDESSNDSHTVGTL
jgi:hypothetical protein